MSAGRKFMADKDDRQKNKESNNITNKKQQLGKRTVTIFTATECSEVCSEDPSAQDGTIIKYLAEIQQIHLQGPTRCATNLIIACVDRVVYCITLSCSPEC